jgi:hypothetical protein
VSFTVFTRTRAWSTGDLYAERISEFYKGDVLAATWLTGKGFVLNHFCKPKYQFNTFNVKSYTIAGYTMANEKVWPGKASSKNVLCCCHHAMRCIVPCNVMTAPLAGSL